MLTTMDIPTEERLPEKEKRPPAPAGKLSEEEILDLYFARSEEAIAETDRRCGQQCRSLTRGILGSREDSEECVNDTYFKLWSIIPPQRPAHFFAFVLKTARNMALNMLERASAKKRGGQYTAVAYDELSECIPDSTGVEKVIDDMELARLISAFVRSLSGEKQIIFLRRYWFFVPVADIAEQMNISESKVKMTLHRTREAFRSYLEKEGVEV